MKKVKTNVRQINDMKPEVKNYKYKIITLHQMKSPKVNFNKNPTKAEERIQGKPHSLFQAQRALMARELRRKTFFSIQ